MKKWIQLPILIGYLFATGCAISIQMPSTHFINPEAAGKLLGGEIDLRVPSSQQVEVITSRFSTTPGQTPVQSEGTGVGAGGELGLLDRLDLIVHTSSEAPVYAGAKFQVLGESRMNAKKGNFSVAVAGLLTLGGGSETATDGSVESKAERSFSGYHATALAGYRPTDEILLYGGPYMSNIDATVTVTRTENGTSTETASPKGEATQIGAVAGVRFGFSQKFFLNLEAAYGDYKYKRVSPSELSAENLSAFVLGGKAAFAW